MRSTLEEFGALNRLVKPGRPLTCMLLASWLLLVMPRMLVSEKPSPVRFTPFMYVYMSLVFVASMALTNDCV